MADSWGPRKTVSVFFVLAGIGSLLMGIAPNLTLAIVGRVLVGLGVSTVFVCNFKLLSEWFSTRQFVIMGGVFMAMGGVGALSASAPLAWISNIIGWRMTLVVVGIITLFMAALVYVFVRNRPSEMSLAPIEPERDEVQDRIGLVNGIKMVVFSSRFYPISIWTFCVIGISFAVGGLWGGPYLMQVYGLSKTAAGGVLSTFALALIFGSPLLSLLANRLGRKPVLIGCSVILLVVCGLMSYYVNKMPLPALYILFFCFFLAGGSAGPVVAAVSKELYPISIAGTSVGLVNLFPFIGAAVFQVLIGAVLTAGGHEQARYTVDSFRYMFLICGASAALSLVAAALLQETLKVKSQWNKSAQQPLNPLV